MSDLAHHAHELLQRQKREWALLREGYEALGRAATRTFDFDGFHIKLQHNPGRIASSSAPVDEDSIRARPCFLCGQNRPPEQVPLALGDDLLLLCNPYPIFPEHFTIPTAAHVPQHIAPSFGRMLALARELHERYLVFYNGPRCGASAPDHLHFQAGTRDFMPIDSEYDRVKRAVVEAARVKLFASHAFLRRFVSLESDDVDALRGAFELLHNALGAFDSRDDADDEPMMNVHASFDPRAGWRVVVFPRARHRPSFYLAGGDDRILLSPAAVDLGGVCITPLERDFERLTAEQIVQMFEEVTLPADQFEQVLTRLRVSLSPEGRGLG